MPPKKARRAFNKAVLNESESDEESREKEEDVEADDEDDDGEDSGEGASADRTAPTLDDDSNIPVTPQPGQRSPGHGKLPPKVAKLDYKGKMRFFDPEGNRHWVLRDIGFSGVIGGRIVWTFGDTLMGRPKNNVMVSNCSTAVGSMKNPMTATNTAIKDGPRKACRQWIQPTEEERKQGGVVRFGLGGTNVVEYAPNKGLVYYMKNDRGGGKPKIPGTGVAYVRMGPHNVPKSTRANDGALLWNNREPKFGDVGVAYNAQDGKIYVYGHGPNGDPELSLRCFLCRAPVEQADKIEAYEYWNGKAKEWTTKRFTKNGEPGTLQIEPKMAVWGWRVVNQTYPFWSNYFNCWMILHGDCWGYSPILCRTAHKLEGPWHDHGIVAKTVPKQGGHHGGFRYAQAGHPQFDPTGKTVLATWTRSNSIWGVVITWE